MPAGCRRQSSFRFLPEAARRTPPETTNIPILSISIYSAGKIVKGIVRLRKYFFPFSVSAALMRSPSEKSGRNAKIPTTIYLLPIVGLLHIETAKRII